ncbi:tautomerase family protein [Streptomyces mirabilis]|uniref:tautomerase family protein n=1 Tax=Streptomyces mirabilis TaxID=68239 RepID=UPI003665B804
MPYIQVDLREGLSAQELAELGARIVDIVHETIGSARPHINVAIRQLPSAGLVESGGTVTPAVSE